MTPAFFTTRLGRAGRRRVRACVSASVVAGICAFSAPAALADVGVSSFSVTPSTTQAGIPSSSSGPDINIDAKFSSSNWDTANLATISLPPGLLANPQAASKCSAVDFQFDHCSGSSWIGSGWTTATAPGFFGFTQPFATNAYLVQPQGNEPARIGLIVNFFGWPVESATAPVKLRTTPGNVGLDIDFAGLPNLWNGISIVIDELQLTIRGSVNGKIFTRNPTACSPATSTISVVSYGNSGTTATGSSTFTPTGCNNLSYNPQLTNAVQLDTGDSGLAYGAQVTQSPFEAATRSIVLTTPPSLSPNIPVIAQACTSSNVWSCPAVGSASATTPILPNSVVGKVVLVAGPSGTLPHVALLFSDPFPAEIDGTITVNSTATQLTTTFTNLPDVPLTSLIVVFDGGSGSIFRAGTHICDQPQPGIGAFTAFNAATASQTVNAQIMGCPATTAAALADARRTGVHGSSRLVARAPKKLLAIVRRHARLRALHARAHTGHAVYAR